MTIRLSTSTGSAVSILFVFSTSSGVLALVLRLVVGARTAVLNAVRGYTPFLQSPHQLYRAFRQKINRVRTNNKKLISTYKRAAKNSPQCGVCGDISSINWRSSWRGVSSQSFAMVLTEPINKHSD